ncbi:proline racemase [Caballeronia udeis]|uniref:Proline racemase n=1 Tax=Caballeronia udeis TaxID=1232866 RepID=A0ABW8MIL1_9BURK
MRWKNVLNVVECHAEGELGKVVTGGLFNVPGATVFDKMLYLEEHRDDLRKLCLFEPRGSAVHSVNFLIPATDPAAQMGYVIAESTEYPAMSGSNTICVATVLLETGILPMSEPVSYLVLEAPAGLIQVRCECRDGKVTQVRFTNQPAFAQHLDAFIEVEKLGTIQVDVGYGGMTYAIVDAENLGFGITRDEARELCELGQIIKVAAAEQLPCVHPTNPLIKGITQTEFVTRLRREDGVVKSRNTVIVSPGRCDRSPCGTGTSARLAVMHAKGLIAPGETFLHESIIGSVFDSRIESLTKVGGLPAVVPSVAGQGWIAAMSQYGLDPSDRFPKGYTLSDTWLEAVDDKLIRSRDL